MPHFECGAFDHSATSPRSVLWVPAKALPGRGSAPLAHGFDLAKQKAATFCTLLLVCGVACAYMQGMDRASFFSPQAGHDISAPPVSSARFSIGEVVRHRTFGFRGVVVDVDPVFANSEEWYQSIPEDIRPVRDQPYYHLLAENDESSYVAYVSQQNLLGDADAGPVDHPSIEEMFEGFRNGRYHLHRSLSH